MEGIKLYVAILCLIACDAYDKDVYTDGYKVDKKYPDSYDKPAVYTSEEKYDDKTEYPEGYKASKIIKDASAKKVYSPVNKSGTKYTTSKGCGPFNCYYAFDCGFAPQLCTANCLKHKGCKKGNCVDNSWCCCDECLDY
ncbi:uncharacterized protein [Mytilus edulis]|uniref:uncharacterized protein n=1 Tax=Mytilus edulis TaxID=6550 RepID=UPI0039EFCD3F